MASIQTRNKTYAGAANGTEVVITLGAGGVQRPRFGIGLGASELSFRVEPPNTAPGLFFQNHRNSGKQEEPLISSALKVSGYVSIEPGGPFLYDTTFGISEFNQSASSPGELATSIFLDAPFGLPGVFAMGTYEIDPFPGDETRFITAGSLEYSNAVPSTGVFFREFPASLGIAPTDPNDWLLNLRVNTTSLNDRLVTGQVQASYDYEFRTVHVVDDPRIDASNQAYGRSGEGPQKVSESARTIADALKFLPLMKRARDYKDNPNDFPIGPSNFEEIEGLLLARRLANSNQLSSFHVRNLSRFESDAMKSFQSLESTVMANPIQVAAEIAATFAEMIANVYNGNTEEIRNDPPRFDTDNLYDPPTYQLPENVRGRLGDDLGGMLESQANLALLSSGLLAANERFLGAKAFGNEDDAAMQESLAGQLLERLNQETKRYGISASRYRNQVVADTMFSESDIDDFLSLTTEEFESYIQAVTFLNFEAGGDSFVTERDMLFEDFSAYKLELTRELLETPSLLFPAVDTRGLFELMDDFLASNPSDYNGDGVVNGADLAEWIDGFGVGDQADSNADGDTDGSDFLAWQIAAEVEFDTLQNWRLAYGQGQAGDWDGDGDTDGQDFLVWQMASVGQTSQPTSIPEPSGISLGFLACPALLAWLRRRQY